MRLEPVGAVAATRAYRVPKPSAPCDLRLDGNEGLPCPPALLAALADADPDVVRTYPSVARLEARLAEALGVAADQVLVTAGADDALDRACRALLGPGRRLVVPTPTFEMLLTYARLSGAALDAVPWADRWPLDAVRAALRPNTTAVAIVSPNNPTGGEATLDDLRAVAASAPIVLLDHAYVEFGSVDLTADALALGNVLVFRTLSKAWGLAGLRVGYVAGPAEVIGWLRRVGLPYPVSGPSAWLALRRLDARDDVDAFVADVRRRRSELARALGAPEGGGNFVFVRRPDAARLWEGLARHGIAVRAWPGHPELADALRVSVPVTEADQRRLLTALEDL